MEEHEKYRFRTNLVLKDLTHPHPQDSHSIILYNIKIQQWMGKCHRGDIVNITTN
jgi:hypothetical protein